MKAAVRLNCRELYDLLDVEYGFDTENAMDELREYEMNLNIQTFLSEL